MQITPLFPIYEKYQAKVVDFHGWNLPVQFGGIIQEHLTVRNQVGIFDVSHMGEILVEGPQASEFLDYVLVNQISTLKPGLIRYSPLCFEHGGTVDDLLVYCFTATKFLLVVNASNIIADYHWLEKLSSPFKVSLTNISAETAQLALQGPHALALLSQLTDFPLSELKYYQFIPQIMLGGKFPVLISHTGYTGEDGFEIYLEPAQAIKVWELLMDIGTPLGIKPIGLGARDTLRFEASLPLYGNELSENISPMEAGLERFIKFTKATFIGKTPLLEQKLNGVPRSLAGIEMIERGIPRSGCQILKDDRVMGYVTSGSYCPSLEKNLALVLIPSQFNTTDLELQVDIRGKLTTAKVVKLPFYARPKGVF
jgi:glycine cleavage system T protein (aminomethyltransferase)